MYQWQKAKDIKVGDTVLIAGHAINVVALKILPDEKVQITAEQGHNGVKGQLYHLESWQEVEVEK